MTIRLGGFHLLMSFLGSIGFIIGGSGLDELWAEVYAKQSVVHMMTGHAYDRSLRAQFLTQEALATLLLSQKSEFEGSEKEQLLSLYEDAQAGKLYMEDFTENAVVSRLLDDLRKNMENISKTNRTAKLWRQYYKQVSLVRHFIRAERTGNWKMHLHCISEMLPYFHSAGHFNYAKSAHLYLQHMLELQTKMDHEEFVKYTEKGYFTIKRTHEFWSGAWPDMVIEQDLMRPLKTRGGLSHGRCFTDSSIAHFVQSFPGCLQLNKAIEEYIYIYYSRKTD